MSDFLIGVLVGAMAGFTATLISVVLVDWYERVRQPKDQVLRKRNG